MINAAVFDLDDTLYPERDYVSSGFGAVVEYIQKKYGISGVDKELNTLFDADKNDVYARLLAKYGLPREENGAMIEIYRAHKPEKLELFPDVYPALELLKSRGVKTGIITDGRADGQRNKVEALGIKNSFDYIVYTYEFGGAEYGKPHPISYETIARQLNVDYGEMMYIGDNPIKDFAVALTLPITTVEIVRGNKIHGNTEYLNGYVPPKIYSLTEIEEFL